MNLFSFPVQFQACTACGTLVLAFFLSKLCLKFSPKSTEEDIVKVWKNKAWKLLERILFPLISAFALLVALSAFERMAWSTNELLKPVLSLSIAWLSYRMIGFFIKSRAWLRLLAVLAFGLAALQVFRFARQIDRIAWRIGFQSRRSKSFSIGPSEWYCHFDVPSLDQLILGSKWRETHQGASPLAPFLQVLLAKVLRAFLVSYLCHRSQHGRFGLVLLCPSGWCDWRRNWFRFTEGGIEFGEWSYPSYRSIH